MENNSNSRSASITFSIIVCCYNSEKRIEQTLQHIYHLDYKPELFEVIIVDNASTDFTVEKAKAIDTLWNINKCHLHFVSEQNPGLNFARITGASTAQFEYLVFCDDDNWLSPDFLSRCNAIIQKNNQIDILGTNGTAIFENEKPFWFELHKPGFAASKITDTFENITSTNKSAYGAGMVVKKDVFKLVSNVNFITTDRVKNLLSSGGDTEICLISKLLGKTVFFDPNIHFQHFMPENRMSWEYCRKLFRSFGNSNCQLQPYYFLLSKSSHSFHLYYFKFWFRNLKKLLASPKRLYFYMFRDLPGEEYFTIYDTSYSVVTRSFKLYLNIYSHYKYLKTLKS